MCENGKGKEREGSRWVVCRVQVDLVATVVTLLLHYLGTSLGVDSARE